MTRSIKRYDDSVPALSNRPVWEMEADGLLLDPGPEDLGRRYDVLVVGGGVIGLATAALCRRAGLGRVAVLERGRLASGPSGRGGGVLAPELHDGTDPDCLVTFARQSLALWTELDREWDGALGIDPLDILQVPPPTGAKPPPGGEPASGGKPAAGAPPLGTEKPVETRVAAGRGAVLHRGQARVHPLRLAAALARRAGTVATGVQVTGVETAGAGGLRVRTDRGEVDAGAVVLATGGAPSLEGLAPPGGNGLAGPAAGGGEGLAEPGGDGAAPRAPGGERSVKGTLLATVPAPFRLGAAIAGRGGVVFQLPDGRLVFGNTYDPADPSPEVRPETLATTRADLAALAPDTAGLPLSHAWTCFRPATGDGLPVIDRLHGLDHVWATYGHFRTGFLLAAATGQALATWISSGERPEDLAPFSAPQ
jgi:glycine/D-amino acid oxidase-like deaminating enzyme